MTWTGTIGAGLARGVSRHLVQHGFVSLTEFVPEPGLRVDVIGLGPKGEIWIVECKSGRSDYVTDQKWENYLPWCDRFFWAVGQDFPLGLLPSDHGLIIADSYGAEISRMADVTPVSTARRKATCLKFARTAAQRLLNATDQILP